MIDKEIRGGKGGSHHEREGGTVGEGGRLTVNKSYYWYSGAKSGSRGQKGGGGMLLAGRIDRKGGEKLQLMRT